MGVEFNFRWPVSAHPSTPHVPRFVSVNLPRPIAPLAPHGMVARADDYAREVIRLAAQYLSCTPQQFIWAMRQGGQVRISTQAWDATPEHHGSLTLTAEQAPPLT